MKPGENKLLRVDLRDEDDSSSSIDDEAGELLTDELEEGFFKVLSRLKKKDPKLYDENVKFFSIQGPDPGKQELNMQKKEGTKQTDKGYKEWLKGQKDKLEDEGIKGDLEALHDFWTDPTLNKGELFLRDFILNKKFLDHDENFNVGKELEKLEEEEKELEEQVIFEHNYNCRFEKPDEEFLKKHPNIMKNTIGKKREFKSKEIKDKVNELSGKNGELQVINKSKKRKKKSRKSSGVMSQTNTNIKAVGEVIQKQSPEVKKNNVKSTNMKTLMSEYKALLKKNDKQGKTNLDSTWKRKPRHRSLKFLIKLEKLKQKRLNLSNQNEKSTKKKEMPQKNILKKIEERRNKQKMKQCLAFKVSTATAAKPVVQLIKHPKQALLKNKQKQRANFQRSVVKERKEKKKRIKQNAAKKKA